MRIKTGYVFKSVGEVPVTIAWTCSKCGAENAKKSKIRANGVAHGKLNDNKALLAKRAQNDTITDFYRIIENINYGDYKRANLLCSCSSCGAQPVWTKFLDVTDFWITILLWFGLLCVVLMMLEIISVEIGVKVLLCIAVLPRILAPLHNSAIEKAVNKLSNDNRPLITVEGFNHPINNFRNISTADAEKSTAKSEKRFVSGKLIAFAVAMALVLCILPATVALYYSGSPAKRIARAKVGSTIYLGSYEQDNDVSNGAEDIAWIVLDRKGDHVLLISKYALDAKAFNMEDTDVTWENCTLRTWLNGQFYTTAFDAEDQTLIETTTVTVAGNQYDNLTKLNDTEDKVFLLSIQEAEQYFATNVARTCVPTNYAIANGARTSSSTTSGGNDSCCWWLRSSNNDGCYPLFVYYAGWCNTDGCGVSNKYLCVRPALWVDLAS